MRYLALLLIVLSMSAGATTPVVSNVTGTVATGQTLTITGTTMMDSDTANWDFSESASSFEGASPAADGWTADIGTLVTKVKLLGSKSLHQQYTGLWSGPDGHPGRFYRTSSSMKPPFWVRAYVRTDSNTVGDGSWPDTYHKLFSHYGSGANSVFVDWQVFGGGSPPTVLTFIDTGNHATNSIVFQELKWHCVEMRFPSSGSPNVQIYWS